MSGTDRQSWTSLAEVRAIRPILEANRLLADEQARMAPAVLEATRKAGVYTLVSPKELGGAEVSFPELMAIFEELGYSDPTIAWHAGNSFSLSGQGAYYLDEEFAREVFSGPQGPYGFAGVPQGRATPVEGGYVLNGKWPFMTGALDARWSVLNGFVMNGDEFRMHNGTPDFRSFIVPGSEIAISGNWATASAMRGTGSHAVEVHETFVPEGRTLGFPPSGPKRFDPPISRLPMGTQSPVTNAAIVAGLARKALETVIETMTPKVSRFDGTVYRENPGMQRRVAHLSTSLQVVQAGLDTMSADIWNRTLSDDLDHPSIGRMWSMFAWTMDQCRDVVSDAMTLATSSVYGSRNPVETSLRDIHAICASMEGVRLAQDGYGRVLLGLPPNAPPMYV